MYGLLKANFATVDELFDLFDEQVPGIESMRQLKNFQRAFTIKEIRSIYQHELSEKRILDVGAGFDLSTIYSLRREYGAECHVLDNYDGEWQSRGGKTLDDLKRNFPGICYVKGLAGTPELHMLPDSYFDIIYSVSVLEHIPQEMFIKSMDDMHRMLRNGGVQIHTIDVPLDDGGRKLQPFLNYFTGIIRSDDRKLLPTGIIEAQSSKNIFLEPPDILKRYWWPHIARKDVVYERWTSFNIVLKKI